MTRILPALLRQVGVVALKRLAHRVSVGSMWLSRAALIELSDPAPLELSRRVFLASNGCTVTVSSIGGAKEMSGSPADGTRVTLPREGDATTVGVSVILGVGPPDLLAGRLLVPSEPRVRAEAAIEEYADLLAVTQQCRRIVRSPMAACVAMAAVDDAERAAIADVTEWQADSQTPGVARVLPTLAPHDVQPLFEDRPDAVALLADAVSEPNAAARARELFRLLERAFTKASTPLIDPLTGFLSSHPRQDVLQYDRDEVTHWLTVLRPQTVHGDHKHKSLARSADVQPYLGRLEVAAYDVVLNKRNWQRSDSARRDGQPLLSAVQADRHSVVLMDPAATIRTHWKDSFGKYPTDWTARISLGSEWIWAAPGQRDGFDRETVKQGGWDLH